MSLPDLSFLSGLSADSSQRLSRCGRTHRFGKNEIIVRRGQKIGGVYIVLSGQLRVYTLDSQGNEKPIYQLNNGDICLFTIGCVMNQMRYPAWVVVDSSEVDVLAVPASDFRSLFHSDTSVRDYVLDALSFRVFDLMSAVEAQSTFEVGDRINSFLVRQTGIGDDNEIRLSHQDIATRLGTAREVVSRHLKDLERQGLVALGRMKVQVLHPEKLASLGSAEL